MATFRVGQRVKIVRVRPGHSANDLATVGMETSIAGPALDNPFTGEPGWYPVTLPFRGGNWHFPADCLEPIQPDGNKVIS